MSTRSPCTSARPVRTAAPLPWFVLWWITRTVESSSAPSTLSEPSLLPSSTTMIWSTRDSGRSTARMRRITSATVARSLNTGMMT